MFAFDLKSGDSEMKRVRATAAETVLMHKATIEMVEGSTSSLYHV
jgi:hypothetical protein